MKSWKLQQLEQDLVKIFNRTLISGEIQEIVNSGGETAYLVPGVKDIENTASKFRKYKKKEVYIIKKSW
ncbi:Uncharacterised protein [Orientia tsutsugamushi]|uniref:Uncharacterized protein n=1 Tax=Orientia tsutsugamushi TaxID=784 RepID=A0A2U3QQM6_ORITS|nr:hypothetical protein [Orientia tsutsugamushi]KJV72930.1 hypothetical protein OTSUT76_3234 [Orientia tsutsugamushi str. UT76]KJV73537.1 hypothetical protein OTSUT76_3087 [Orientia tsutsugamushi str. UT76]SPR03267.1 Uncharacterised protein [Orientia tsutsugamushi]SPR05756.1 Uncharacterised protein [Orientia tsutsugamushi]SPR06503.1 Uncharacterised protein [Orientia tsutsugamushi]